MSDKYAELVLHPDTVERMTDDEMGSIVRKLLKNFSDVVVRKNVDLNCRPFATNNESNWNRLEDK